MGRTKEKRREYYLANRERELEAQRRYRKAKGKSWNREKGLKRFYGISIEEYNAMVEAQHGRCAICGNVPKCLYVDHCHTTKKVRGLLCSRCNFGIGQFRDNPETLLAAINYLGGLK